jgi:hypothetical protein
MKAFVTVLMVGSTLLLAAGPGFATTTNLYFTHFEATNGFSLALPLIGQSGWTGQGNNGNGVTNNYVPGQGQQAYVGYKFSLPAEDVLAWRPLNFNPLTAGYPIVKFSVLMSIEDSNNNERDNFRWSVYNAAGVRLFALDFDNYDLKIRYDLDDTNDLVDAGWTFDNSTDYELAVTMNFSANRWSATLNQSEIVSNQPITTKGAALTLGDIDAVWLPYFTNAPGNNFMLFDEYRVTAETIPVTPALVTLLGRTTEGWRWLQVSGPEGSRWAVEATTNFVNWTALKTNPISGGSFDFMDTAAAGQTRRFYRARHVP